jgi:hypothetical protein
MLMANALLVAVVYECECGCGLRVDEMNGIIFQKGSRTALLDGGHSKNSDR